MGAMPEAAKAWLPHGTAIPKGWNTLPLGAGGLITGLHIANDGRMVCRSDVGGAFRWSGTSSTTTNPSDKWKQLYTVHSFADNTGAPIVPFVSGTSGCLEIVQAPSDSTKLFSIGPCCDGVAGSYVYYSINDGATWIPCTNTDAATNFKMANADSNGTPPGVGQFRYVSYHIAVDPVNPSVVYVLCVASSGNGSSVFFSNDGKNFSGIAALGTGASVIGAGVGVTFDTSGAGGLVAATTVVGLQTRTSRIVICSGGNDVYESLDGGQTWNSTGCATFLATSAFYANQLVVNSNGVIYANINGKGLYRYTVPTASSPYTHGTWSSLSVPAGAATGIGGTCFLIDPSHPTNLTVCSGDHGYAYGASSTNADTGTPPTWTSTTPNSGNIVPTAPTYDAQYLRFIFGQGSSFFFGCYPLVDSDGDTIFCGNQSIWKVTGVITYNGAETITPVSFCRGIENTVAYDAFRPSGGAYPLMAVQDIGGVPLNGTFTSYPTDLFHEQREWVSSNYSESPTNGSFIVCRITSQGGSFVDGSGFSRDAGKTWTAFPSYPTALFNSSVTASCTSGVMTVTAVLSGSKPFIGQEVTAGADQGWITGYGTVNPDGTGTYNLIGTPSFSSQTVSLAMLPAGGQILAVDESTVIIVPSGFSHGTIPVIGTTTDNWTTASWAFCNLSGGMNGFMPAANWMHFAWTFGNGNAQPFCAGKGTDVGKVWAALWDGSSTITIYYSSDKGANFTALSTVSPVSTSTQNLYLFTVPGNPGHLWLTANISGGLNGNIWRSTDGGNTWATLTPPTIPGHGTPLTGGLDIGAADPNGGGYPTIWFTGRASGLGNNSAANIFYSTNGDQVTPTWTALGTTGISGCRPDLPDSCSLDGIDGIHADPGVFKRLYISGGTKGFAYYNP